MKWLYCLGCERAFQSNSETTYCGYLDCHSHTSQVYEWDAIRGLNPHYPETPIKGAKYPPFD
jgi:hypothetical protein